MSLPLPVTTPLSPAVRAARSARGLPARAGVWVVAYAFLVVMAFSALPTPLYVLYDLSPVMITVVFAAYAAGVVVSLFAAGHLSDVYGRRPMTLIAIAANLVSAALFLVWREDAALVFARVVSGLGVGALTATATAWILELHARPGARPRRAQALATAANLGGIGLGPLLAGVLAQWVAGPLTTPFVVMIGALGLAMVGVACVPETRSRTRPTPTYRPQRVAVPDDGRAVFFADVGAVLVGYAMLGMFMSLAPSFIAGTLHHPSRAVAGATAFLVFASAAAAQIFAGARPPYDILRVGLFLLALGPALLIAAVWLPSLAAFLVGGVVSGAGTGLTVKGALGTAAELAPPERRAEAISGVFLAGYFGLSLPVIGLGVLTQELPPDQSLTVFATLVAIFVVAAGTLGRRARRLGVPQAATQDA